MGDSAGDAGLRTAKALGGGGSGVVVVYLSAALAWDHRLFIDRATLSDAAADGVAGAALAAHPGGAGAETGDRGGGCGGAVVGAVVAAVYDGAGRSAEPSEDRGGGRAGGIRGVAEPGGGGF